MGDVIARGLANQALKKEFKAADLKDATRGNNLANKDAFVVGNYVQYSNGLLAANASYQSTDFVKLEPNTSYSRSYSHQMAIYDENQKYVSGINALVPAEQSSTFTTPANAKYARFTVSNAQVDSFMVNKGTSLLPYESYYIKINNLKADAKTPLGNVDVVITDNVKVLTNIETDIYYEGIAKSKSPISIVNTLSNKGLRRTNEFRITSTAPETFTADIVVNDLYLDEIKKKRVTIESLTPSKTVNTRYLPIGDSITRDGSYAREVSNLLSNASTVGTRTYDNGALNVEGRGGWKVTDYLTRIGNSSIDSPFIFPVGVAGAKFKGNTEFWRKVCHTDSNGYDFQGFQKIARGWGATTDPYLFNTSGYPVSPVTDDVVIDPTKADGSKWQKYNGTSWVAMNPQPSTEFSFSKYVERFASAFPNGNPNLVSIMLGTNDVMPMTSSTPDIASIVTGIQTIVNSIREFDANMKIIFLIPSISNTQDYWATANTYSTAYTFDRNVFELGKKLIETFDKSASKNYVFPFNAFIKRSDLADHVHPTSAGHQKAGEALAALVEYIR